MLKYGIMIGDWLKHADFFMTQKSIKWLVVLGVMLGTAVWLTTLSLRAADARPSVTLVVASRSQPVMPVVVPAAKTDIGNVGVLDARHRLALGMIETGNRDNEIGGAGEISRYQIKPAVWKQYSQSENYEDPAVASLVAKQHWTVLYANFKKQTHREPTDFDMYVLWNTGFGYYAAKGFDSDHLNAVVRDRAQRFANLVQCRDL
jgi:hypothetical protein